MSQSDDKLSTAAGLNLFGRVAEQARDPFLGRSVGDYEVLELIAEGGMGRVYRARRSDGSFDRDVAIKVSAISRLSTHMAERFAREQAVLASLNHANITQLYDARFTEDGWPYIVMELVEGVPFTQYCQDQDLSLESRVRIAIDIVDAVASAHARLVVHRDIKPSNVLVDATGQAKLLDFGIAKLLNPDTDELTHTGPMTPRYASPEQLRGEDITIASDIFQLGLLIAEAVTGNALGRSAGKPVDPAMEPLANLSAADRGRLPRDLLAIIQQCLNPEPTARYGNANGLRDDLRRFLDGFPVLAAGPRTGYAVRKWIGRNQLTAASLALAVLLVTGGAVWHVSRITAARDEANRQAAEASLQAQRAEEISGFLTELLGAAKPAIARGETATVRSVLEQGVERVRADLSDKPALQAALFETMGDVYTDLALFDQAETLLRDAVAIHRDLGDSNRLPIAGALGELAQLVRSKGQFEQSLALQEEALNEVAKHDSPEARALQAELANGAGFSASKANNFEAAEKYHTLALKLRSELFGPRHIQTSQTLSSYGMLLFKTGRTEEALPYLRDALEIADDQVGPFHPVISTRAINLANALGDAGREAESEPLLLRAIEVDKKLYGPNHHYVASGMLSLAALHRRLGRMERAAQVMGEALPIEIASLGADHVDTGNTRYQLASILVSLNRLKEAEELLEVADEVIANALSGDHQYFADLWVVRAELATAQGKANEALAHYTQAVAMFERLFGPTHPRLVYALFASAEVSREAGQLDQALEQQTRAIAGLEARGASATKELAQRLAAHGDLLEEAGRHEAAGVARRRSRELAQL